MQRKVSEEVEEAVRTMGARIALARKRRLLSQDSLARSAGVTRLLLSRIERGSTTSSLASYVALLLALGLEDHVEAFGHPDRDANGKAIEAMALKRRIRGRNEPY